MNFTSMLKSSRVSYRTTRKMCGSVVCSIVATRKLSRKAFRPITAVLVWADALHGQYYMLNRDRNGRVSLTSWSNSKSSVWIGLFQTSGFCINICVQTSKRTKKSKSIGITNCVSIFFLSKFYSIKTQWAKKSTIQINILTTSMNTGKCNSFKQLITSFNYFFFSVSVICEFFFFCDKINV